MSRGRRRPPTRAHGAAGVRPCPDCHYAVRWLIMWETRARMAINPEPDPERGHVRINDYGRGIALSHAQRDAARAAGEDLYLAHRATCPAQRPPE